MKHFSPTSPPSSTIASRPLPFLFKTHKLFPPRPPPSAPLSLRWLCSLPRCALFPLRAAVEPEPVCGGRRWTWGWRFTSSWYGRPSGSCSRAGRWNLVDPLTREGGWLAFGWNVDEEEDGRVSQGRLSVEGGSFPPEKEVAGYSGRSGRALSSLSSSSLCSFIASIVCFLCLCFVGLFAVGGGGVVFVLCD